MANLNAVPHDNPLEEKRLRDEIARNGRMWDAYRLGLGDGMRREPKLPMRPDEGTEPQKFRQETHHPQCASILSPGQRPCNCWHVAGASRETAGDAELIRCRSCYRRREKPENIPEGCRATRFIDFDRATGQGSVWVCETCVGSAALEFQNANSRASRSGGGDTRGDGAPDGAEFDDTQHESLSRRFAVFAYSIDGYDTLSEDEQMICRDAARWAMQLRSEATPENPAPAASSPVGDREPSEDHVTALVARMRDAFNSDDTLAATRAARGFLRDFLRANRHEAKE